MAIRTGAGDHARARAGSGPGSPRWPNGWRARARAPTWPPAWSPRTTPTSPTGSPATGPAARRPGRRSRSPGRCPGCWPAWTGPCSSTPSGTWIANDARADIDGLVAALASRRGDTIVVSEEVGLGVHPVTEVGRLFADRLGEANRRVAEVADRCLLVVAGRVIELPAGDRRRPSAPAGDRCGRSRPTPPMSRHARSGRTAGGLRQALAFLTPRWAGRPSAEPGGARLVSGGRRPARSGARRALVGDRGPSRAAAGRGRWWWPPTSP